MYVRRIIPACCLLPGPWRSLATTSGNCSSVMLTAVPADGEGMVMYRMSVDHTCDASDDRTGVAVLTHARCTLLSTAVEKARPLLLAEQISSDMLHGKRVCCRNAWLQETTSLPSRPIATKEAASRCNLQICHWHRGMWRTHK
jgi:hypothetical protein